MHIDRSTLMTNAMVTPKFKPKNPRDPWTIQFSSFSGIHHDAISRINDIIPHQLSDFFG